MTLFELVLVILIYGSPVFLLGRILQVIVLKRKGIAWTDNIIVVVITQLASLLLTMVIMKLWPDGIDIMFKFIAYPALVTEIIILSFGYLGLILFIKRWV